jgi:CRP-like cAMP-binding protein
MAESVQGDLEIGDGVGEESFHFIVDEPENCPLFHPGDKMILRPPEVSPESTGICAEGAGAFMQVLRILAAGTPREALGEKSSLTCPGCSREGGKTTFHLEVVGAEKEEKSDEKIRYLVDLLGRIPMFAPLQERPIKEIIRHLGVQRYGSSEMILSKGDTGRNLFILVKGNVEVLQEDGEGHKTVIATLKDGDCFGEMSLITGDPCSADIRTKGDVLCLVMKKESFDQVLSRHPSLNIYFTKLLSQRLKQTSTAVADELEKGIIGRLSLISLPEMVQAVTVSRRTGVLRLSSKGEVAEVAFKEGQIFQVRYGDLEGENAFYKLLTWKTGNFRFQPNDGTFERKISLDTMSLLMEGLRQLDEAARTAGQPS